MADKKKLNPPFTSDFKGLTDAGYRFFLETVNDINRLNAGKFEPPASSTPTVIGDVWMELTNNTTLTIKAVGTDGVVRTAALTLA